MSDEVIKAADEKFKSLSPHNTSIKVDTQWFKPLEAVVINNNPGATARMYNYLVISGLFRSVCTIFLASLWFEFIYLFSKLLGLNPPEGLLMLGNKSVLFQFLSYASLSLVYIFSLFSYLKFQRRYVEDAIFAFVFTKS
ncbi:MAG: hypothetical protein EOP06_28855 [Proteobacteria bacterium]|nr:MAG: hypothetical protein EOP06_28855 [Pseudomonadota bacterium]